MFNTFYIIFCLANDTNTAYNKDVKIFVNFAESMGQKRFGHIIFLFPAFPSIFVLRNII